jgi:outer membrane protein assembly factor BamB
MTFWQDARPATPRFRRPRRGSRRRRRGAWALVAVVVLASTAISIGRAGGEGEAKAGTPAAAAVARGESPVEPGVVLPRWSQSSPDWVSELIPDRGDAIVMSDNWVSAVALADGRVRWRRSIPHLDEGGVVRGDTVLVSSRTGFAALERRTGKIRWFSETPETPGRVALVGPDPAQQIAVVTTFEGGLVGVDARTGTVRWSTRLRGHMQGHPSVDHASGSFAGVWQDDAATTELRLVDAGTGAVRWVRDLGVMAGSPVVVDGMVAVSAGNGEEDSEVRAFALTDGSPRWRSPVAAPSQPQLRPLVDGGDLYVVDQIGNVARIDLADGTRRWSTDTEALTLYALPIRVRDAVIVWNERREVVTLDRATGKIRARRLAAGMPVGLAVTEHLVVVLQRLVRDDALLAFGADRMAGPARSRR